MKLNAHLVKSTVVAALGGLLFGFDTAVISGATGGLAQIYHLSPALLGVTVASALWGTILGAMLAGIPGERFGRRDSLRIMAILYLISALGCAGALMAASSGGYPFVFFAAMMVLQFLVVLFVYPETKGITLEEMQKKIGID